MACLRRLTGAGPIIRPSTMEITMATRIRAPMDTAMAHTDKTKRDTARAVSLTISRADEEKEDIPKNAAPDLGARAHVACAWADALVVAAVAVITQASFFTQFGLSQRNFPSGIGNFFILVLPQLPAAPIARDWCYSNCFRGKLSRGQPSKKHKKIPPGFVNVHETCHISIKIASKRLYNRAKPPL